MDDRLSKTLVKVGDGNTFEEIRFFSNKSIQDSIDAALKNVPEGKSGVILKVDVDDSGEMSAVVAAKPGDNWTIGGVFKYDFYDKTYVAGAEVVFTW